MRPFQIKYRIIGEIRHGSPYNIAELEIVGESKIEIKRNDSWQDKHSWARNQKFLAQVKWDIENSEPGFKIIIFNTENGKTLQTERISGCCTKLRLDNELNLDYETFTQISKLNEKKEYGIIKGKIKQW